MTKGEVKSLVHFVDTCLLEAQRLQFSEDAGFGAVNWADLRVVDVECRKSLLNPDEETVHVLIEEANSTKLSAWVAEQIRNAGCFPPVYVECEW